MNITEPAAEPPTATPPGTALRSLTSALSEGHELPAGYDTWGWKIVRPDLRTYGGFRWPWPGNTVTCEDAGPDPDILCGAGLHIALTCMAMQDVSYGGTTVLLLAYRQSDVLARSEIKLRIRHCYVADVIDLPRFLREYSAPDAPLNLRGADLVCANLRRADLGGADLHGANLGGADLVCANLRGADLGGADLEGANLRDADLEGANLNGAGLRRADLGGADLEGANLACADLHAADLGGAYLPGADLRDAYLRRADLGGADLHGANLRGADLVCANLRDANLRGADLGYAGLHGADLGGANLSAADLRYVDLRDADLHGADPGSVTGYIPPA